MIHRACYVACDGPCGGDPAPVSCFGADEARSFARGEGYVRVKVDGRFVDLCPRCQDSMEAK